jgi:hypothetical protein
VGERYLGYIGAGKDTKPHAKSLNKLTQEQYDRMATETFSLEGNTLTAKSHQSIFVVGYVRYKDVFGATGYTSICAASLGNDIRMATCSTGNEMKWEDK